MTTLIPAHYAVAHIKRRTSDKLDPDTGNPVIVATPAVIRYAQDISQIGRMRGSSHQILTAEFVKRIETDLHLAVPDPTVYGPLDQVLLFPGVDDEGDYIPGTGYAFWIDGLPINARQSPWPLFTKPFGGLLRLRRVT